MVKKIWLPTSLSLPTDGTTVTPTGALADDAPSGTPSSGHTNDTEYELFVSTGLTGTPVEAVAYLDAVSINIGGTGIGSADSLGFSPAVNWHNSDVATTAYSLGTPNAGAALPLSSDGTDSGAGVTFDFYNSGRRDTLTSAVADDGTPEWDLFKVGGQNVTSFAQTGFSVDTIPTGWATFDVVMIFDSWRTDQIGNTIQMWDGTNESSARTFTDPGSSLLNGGSIVEGTNCFVWRGLSGAVSFVTRNDGATDHGQFVNCGIQLLRTS